MEKPAQTTYPIHDLIRRRWSPRAFSDRMVEPEKLQSLFEAARWAGSCFNEQPWRFIVCTKQDPEAHRRLVGCLADANVPWAKDAPVLMLSVAKITFSHNDKLNRHALHDVGMAIQNLVIQAMALGLWVHQMAGYDAAKARQVFTIPEGYEPVAAIAIGYEGDPENLPDPLRERELGPRSRKPLSDLVFDGHWGKASTLFAPAT